MADTFDPYREGLVMDTNTIWPDEFDSMGPQEKQRIEDVLHAQPDKCASIEYVRSHTGFCRQITVTAQDMARVGKA